MFASCVVCSVLLSFFYRSYETLSDPQKRKLYDQCGRNFRFCESSRIRVHNSALLQVRHGQRAGIAAPPAAAATSVHPPPPPPSSSAHLHHLLHRLTSYIFCHLLIIHHIADSATRTPTTHGVSGSATSSAAGRSRFPRSFSRTFCKETLECGYYCFSASTIASRFARAL